MAIHVRLRTEIERKQDAKSDLVSLRMEKAKFFEFVRTHQEREASDIVQEKDAIEQLKEDLQEALDTGKALKASKLFKSLEHELTHVREVRR